MYKVASNGRQSALHRGRPSDWANGEERLNLADQITQAQDGVRILEARIIALPHGEERKRLGVEKLAMQQKITELKRFNGFERRAKHGLEQHIIDAAREILSKSEFELIYRAGHRRYEEAQKALARSEAERDTVPQP